MFFRLSLELAGSAALASQLDLEILCLSRKPWDYRRASYLPVVYKGARDPDAHSYTCMGNGFTLNHLSSPLK